MSKYEIAFMETLRYVNFIRGIHCNGCSIYKEGNNCEFDNECLKKDILLIVERFFERISKDLKEDN